VADENYNDPAQFGDALANHLMDEARKRSGGQDPKEPVIISTTHRLLQNAMRPLLGSQSRSIRRYRWRRHSRPPSQWLPGGQGARGISQSARQYPDQ
jgi:hypothetical protein